MSIRGRIGRAEQTEEWSRELNIGAVHMHIFLYMDMLINMCAVSVYARVYVCTCVSTCVDLQG